MLGNKMLSPELCAYVVLPEKKTGELSPAATWACVVIVGTFLGLAREWVGFHVAILVVREMPRRDAWGVRLLVTVSGIAGLVFVGIGVGGLLTVIR